MFPFGRPCFLHAASKYIRKKRAAKTTTTKIGCADLGCCFSLFLVVLRFPLFRMLRTSSTLTTQFGCPCSFVLCSRDSAPDARPTSFMPAFPLVRRSRRFPPLRLSSFLGILLIRIGASFMLKGGNQLYPSQKFVSPPLPPTLLGGKVSPQITALQRRRSALLGRIKAAVQAARPPGSTTSLSSCPLTSRPPQDNAGSLPAGVGPAAPTRKACGLLFS